MGYTATAAGMALAPVGVLAILLSPLVGTKRGRMDPRRWPSVAFLGFRAGAVDALALQRPQADLAPS